MGEEAVESPGLISVTSHPDPLPYPSQFPLLFSPILFMVLPWWFLWLRLPFSTASTLLSSSEKKSKTLGPLFCPSSPPRLSSISPNFRSGQRTWSMEWPDASTENKGPDHLLVLVHGILASPRDWLYAESELKKQLGGDFLIHASSCNTYTRTFRGIDGGGRRLADEVKEIIQKIKGLKKISFLAHSLGGLFSRYAIAVLYSSESRTIAGLKPINFISLATPHLGVRGRKQLPFLLGVPFLEKLAPPIGSLLVGRTGRQLFLMDGRPSKPPLLLRMASDSYELKFISSLGAFRSRMAYANVAYDYMVGWRTSSIRRETELVQPPRVSLEGYKHVVGMEHCPPIFSEDPHFTSEAVNAKKAAKVAPTAKNTNQYHDLMEEEMIHGLQSLGWTKVDVNFHSAIWPFFAHNNIHVKSEWLHNEGAGVIAHVADIVKRQESYAHISANL